MTCIVGLKDADGAVTMGADSASVAGYNIRLRSDPKLFQKDGLLVGFTSSFRMGQLLRFKLSVPLCEPAKDALEYMVSDFVEAVRACLKRGGYAKVEDNIERGGVFLVGRMGRLFEIEGDYQVGEVADAYSAIGCGQDFALGSLYVTEGQPPENRVRTALETAAYFSAGVRPPFLIERIAK